MEMLQQKIEIPEEMKLHHHWVYWKLSDSVDKKTGETKQDKVPYQMNGKMANSTDSNTWRDYDSINPNNTAYNGVGFMLQDSPFTAIDLDDCFEDGVPKESAQNIVDSLDSYTEVSQSGKGLHIFVKAEKPGTRSRNDAKGFEMYDSGRFIAMTGKRLEGTPLEVKEAQVTVNYLYDMFLPDSKEETTSKPGGTSKISQSKVLELLFKEERADDFKNILHGDWEQANDRNSKAFQSASEADQSLMNRLAFYTNGNKEMMYEIWCSHATYRAEKDHSNGGIGKTIQTAINGMTGSYDPDFKKQKKLLSGNELQRALKQRHHQEVEKMIQEWEENNKKGSKPVNISPNKTATILKEYIEFILFDLEENTKLAMYLPDEGIYTRNETKIRRAISWLEPNYSKSSADNVIYKLKNTAIVKEKTNSRYLIPVNNGVFNLQTKKLESFSPDYVFTSKVSTNYRENPRLPFIDGWDVESWLDDISCNDNQINTLLWQVINDSLNGNYTRKKAIFLTGEGNNGKGTFQELITNVIGVSNIATLKVNEFDERFKLSVLEGKTAVIGDDVPPNVYIDDSSNFKAVVTGDRVSVEHKGQPIYNATFHTTVIQSTNGMPRFRDNKTGQLRRLIIVPFNANFEGGIENTDIKEDYIKRPEVLEYVLSKAVNLNFEKFEVPQVSAEALDGFKQDNDPVYEFKLNVFDEWEVTEIPQPFIYDSYKSFCEKNWIKPLSNRQFYKEFEKQIVGEWVKSDTKRRFTDIEIDVIGKEPGILINKQKCKNPQWYLRKL